jgi:hypothetical protein
MGTVAKIKNHRFYRKSNPSHPASYSITVLTELISMSGLHQKLPTDLYFIFLVRIGSNNPAFSILQINEKEAHTKSSA